MIVSSSREIPIRDESAVRIANDEDGAFVEERFGKDVIFKTVSLLHDSTATIDGHYFAVKTYPNKI